MVCLQIEDIQRMFAHLDELKANNWQMKQPVKVVNAKPAHTKLADKKKTITSTTTTTSNDSKPKTVSASKARADAARQRLIEAKKNAALLKQQQQQQDQNVEIITEIN